MKMILLMALSLAAAMPVAADDIPNWYEIELIVFQHRGDAAMTEEVWPDDHGRPALGATAELVPPTLPAVLRPFEQLPPGERRLEGAYRALDRSARYRPLLHTGWRQPGLPREQSVAVRLDEYSGEPLAIEPLQVELPPEGMRTAEAEPEPEPDFLGFRFPELAPEPYRMLSGTVMLVLQRFLHVDADLVFDTGQPLPATIDDPFPRSLSYRLRESRRVRLEELHYFDHPKFGLIVTVRPIPAEEVERRRDNYEAEWRRALLEREAKRIR